MEKLLVLLSVFLLVGCNEIDKKNDSENDASSNSEATLEIVSIDEFIGENKSNLKYDWIQSESDTLLLELSYVGDIEGLAEKSEFIMQPVTDGESAMNNTCEITRIKKNNYRIVKMSSNGKAPFFSYILLIRSDSFFFRPSGNSRDYNHEEEIYSKYQEFRD